LVVMVVVAVYRRDEEGKAVYDDQAILLLFA
jgi:hypothetical protein